jgi:Tfp pilus assembly protein PilX
MKMKIRSTHREGSVLVIALMTITILTMICATSLYITSQNANATTQTTSWQQALAGAEAAVDQGMNALNTGTWTGWYTITGSLPNSKPSNTTTPATGAPAVGQYNYYVPPSLTLQGEASNTMNMWVTVDPVSSTFATNNGQSYRIRATGLVAAPGPARVSNQKLDNDLRKISLHFDRNAGGTVTTPQASRRIEVIAQPGTTTTSTLGIVSRKAFTMAGSSDLIDSFNSTNPLYSVNGHYVNGQYVGGQYDVSVRESHGDVGIIDSTGSNLNNGGQIYGNLTYSGPAVQGKTKNVHGTISTPFTATVPSVSAPNWLAGSYSTSLPAQQGNVITIQGDPNASPPTGTATNPLRYQVSSIALSGNTQSIVIQSPTDPVTKQPLPGYDNVEIWVTGAGGAGTTINGVLYPMSITGNNSGITQDSNATVKLYVQGNIDIAGNGIANLSNSAGNLWIYGISPSDGSTPNILIAGNGAFIGVVDAPAYNTTISGSGTNGGNNAYSLVGAVIGNMLTITGNGSIHYDEALKSRLPNLGPITYSYANWFEDNGDKARGQTF